MSWSSAGLPNMQPSPEFYPLALAADVLAPEPMTARKLRALLRERGIKPVGKWKISGADLGEMRGRRDVPLYSAVEILIATGAIKADQPPAG